jgi:hypothetical protein
VITDREHFHGIAIARILSGFPEGITIRQERQGYRNSYVVNETVGLYFKFATARMSPWSFSFLATQVDELKVLHREFGDAWLVLVCGTEGVAGIRFNDLATKLRRVTLDNPFNLTLTRRPGRSFVISNPGLTPVRVPEAALSAGVLKDSQRPVRRGKHAIESTSDTSHTGTQSERSNHSLTA